jgi:hypothetical protein
VKKGAQTMSDSNPFASLSSTLLARKGHAKPAMRPQGFHVPYEKPVTDLEDLGWNDMGDEAPTANVVVLNPVAPMRAIAAEEAPVPVQQQHDIEREFAPTPGVAPDQTPATRAAPGLKAKAAFTLRLDGDRHLRLRLVCAVNHRSAQQIVTQALDEFLARQPNNLDLTRSSLGARAFVSTGDQQ